MEKEENQELAMCSLLTQLQGRLKSGLKPTTTKTILPDGTVHYSTDQGCTVDSSKSEKNLGFVVDTKPDLTVGQINQWLYISSQDVPLDATLLKKFDITHVLSLLPGFCLPNDSKIVAKNHLVLDVYDEEFFNLKSEICSDGFKFIADAKLNGGRVLIHCNAGISRAPSFAIAYLIQFENLSYESAWNEVKVARPLMKPNAGFVKQLKDF